MGAALRAILREVLGAIVRGLRHYFREWQRDRLLKESGRTEQELRQEAEKHEARDRMEDVPEPSRSDIDQRLRDRSF
jgi:hypothetical protein